MPLWQPALVLVVLVALSCCAAAGVWCGWSSGRIFTPALLLLPVMAPVFVVVPAVAFICGG